LRQVGVLKPLANLAHKLTKKKEEEMATKPLANLAHKLSKPSNGSCKIHLTFFFSPFSFEVRG
jgi:hypothetical protein